MALRTETPSPSGAGAWSELLRAPGVARIVIAGLVARLPLGMNPIGIVLLVREQGDGYGAAGLAAAVYSLAAAGSAVALGRLIDRAGQPRVLIPLSIGFPAAMVGLVVVAEAGAALGWLLACAMLAGALMPPLGACMRALWPGLVARAELRGTAYAMEAVLQEIFFLVGPLLVAVLVALASPSAALAVSAAAAGLGTFVFATAPAARRARLEPRARGQKGSALAAPGVRTIALVSLGMGVAFGCLEVSMPAFGEAHGSRAAGAAMLAAISLGSLLGGVWIGSRGGDGPLMPRYLLAQSAFAAGLAPPLLAGSIPVMAVLVFVAGLAIAPAFAAAYGLIDDAAIPGTTTEAFSWLSTSVVLGVAGGTALAGAVIERSGTDASLGVALAAGGLALAVAVVGRRTLHPAST